MSDLAIVFRQLIEEVIDECVFDFSEETVEMVGRELMEYYGDDIYKILLYLDENEEGINRWLVIDGVIHRWEVEHDA